MTTVQENGYKYCLTIEDSLVSVLDATLRIRLYKQLPESSKRHENEPFLVFLHEGLGCIEMWKEFPLAVCKATGLSGIAYDRQGYGGSSPLSRPRKPDFMHVEAYNYLPALLSFLNVDQSILIGHSDGGSISLLYASAFPNCVRCLVTIAAHVFVEPETVQSISQARELYQTSLWPQKLSKYHGDKTDAIFYAWADTWLSSEFASWNIEQEVKDIQSPMLVMQGVEDKYGTAKQVESIVQNSGGKALPCWIEDCGHVPHIEAQNTVLETVVKFISEYGLRQEEE